MVNGLLVALVAPIVGAALPEVTAITSHAVAAGVLFSVQLTVMESVVMLSVFKAVMS